MSRSSVAVAYRVRRSGRVSAQGARRSSAPGYTLTETLAALAVMSLAIGGLTAAIQVLSRQQAMVADGVSRDRATRIAQVALDRMFQDRGPFRTAEPRAFQGDAEGFKFDCGAAAPCTVSLIREASGLALRSEDGAGGEAKLPLRKPGPAQFEYTGSRTTGQAWPPGGPEPETLRAIALVTADKATTAPTAILQTRLWVEQPTRCAFDTVLQDCF